MKPFLRSGDFWSGLALAALGMFIVAQARGWTYMSEEGPGPGFFPLWYGGIMVVLSLLLVAGAVLKRPNAAGEVNWGDVRRAMLCWAAFVACIIVMGYAGFMIAFALLTWFMAAVMARTAQRIAIPLAIGLAIFFWLLFEKALDVGLPHGALF